MPLPTLSRLTFETGARLKGGFKGRWTAERVISDTTLSLLKPASYAGTFSRDFVSRLRHRNGTVRRGSVFSAGQRSEHANKGCSPLFACSRVRMFAENRAQNRTESKPKLPAAMRIPVLNRAQNRTESGPKLPAAMRTPVLNRAQNRTESGPKLPAAMRTPVLNRAQNRTESGPKLPAAMRIPVLNRARVSSTPSRRVP